MNRRSHKPPAWLDRLVERSCPFEDLEEVLGDLHETYARQMERHGRLRTDARYVLETMTFWIRSIFRSGQRNQHRRNLSMWKNYAVVVLRSAGKHKLFSAVNLFGLAGSMAVCLVIILFVRDQRSYDRFHPDADRLYLVTADYEAGDGGDQWATTPATLGALLMDEEPALEGAVTLRRGFGGIGRTNAEAEPLPISGFHAGPAFFELFGFTLESGDPRTALSEPGSLVLSPAASVRFFGSNDPIGRTIEIDGSIHTVTGVTRPNPESTHLRFDVLAHLPETDLAWRQTAYNHYTYIRVGRGSPIQELENRITALAASRYPETDDAAVDALDLLPVTEYILGPDLNNKIGPRVPTEVVYVLSILALVILLSACSNYVGLSTARALGRAREIGVRKVTGATRSQLVRQFLAESILFAVVSAAAAAALLPVLLPIFNAFDFMQATGTVLVARFGSDIGLYGTTLVFALAVGSLAGIYPALYLSSFTPSTVLKGVPRFRGMSGSLFRKSLIVGQFTLSLLFIILTLVFYRQYRHILSTDYGFESAGIVNVQLQDVPYDLFRDRVMQEAAVESVSATSYLPASGDRSSMMVDVPGSDDTFRSTAFSVDEGFIPNLGLEVIAGRNFSATLPADTISSVIVNETLVRQLGLETTADAVGIELAVQSDEARTVAIVGVVKDYHAETLTHTIAPVTLTFSPSQLRYANVRLRGIPDAGTTALLRDAWLDLGSDRPLEAEYFEVQLRRRNANFDSLMAVVGASALFALLISCLGLLGMAAYHTQTRLKEIGVRKVLGATSRQVMLVLSSDYLKLIVFSAVIGLPAGYFLSDLWLQQYAVRINVGLWSPAVGLAFTAALAFLAISTQTFRAARMNPVSTLKQE